MDFHIGLVFISLVVIIFNLLLLAGLFLCRKWLLSQQGEIDKIQRVLSKAHMEVQSLSVSNVHLGQKIQSFDKKLLEREHKPVQSREDIHLNAYAHAARMVQTGASRDDVITACGLTYAEAEMVINLHKRKKSS